MYLDGKMATATGGANRRPAIAERRVKGLLAGHVGKQRSIDEVSDESGIGIASADRQHRATIMPP
jgi:hypothetical protein